MSDVAPFPSPPAGWYPDPSEPSVLRRWDGSQWTLDMQPAPQTTPAANGSPWLTNRAAIGIVAVLVVLLSVLFLVVGGGGGDGANDSLTPSEIGALDAEAQSQARLAQSAIETYSTDHGGTYDDATTDALRQIESTLADAVAVEAAGTTYVVTAESESGTSFSIARDSTGMVKFSCDAPAEGGCPGSGVWGQ